MKKQKIQAAKLGTNSKNNSIKIKNIDRSERSFDSSYKSVSNENRNNNLSYRKDKEEANDKVFYINSNHGKNMKFNLQKLKYLIASQIDNYEETNNSQDKQNSNLNKSFQSNTSTSRLEKEMKRKVKTILKRDILGRYRKSPYIKSI